MEVELTDPALMKLYLVGPHITGKDAICVDINGTKAFFDYNEANALINILNNLTMRLYLRINSE